MSTRTPWRHRIRRLPRKRRKRSVKRRSYVPEGEQERRHRKGDGRGTTPTASRKRRRASRLSSIPARTRVRIASRAGAFSIARIPVKARSTGPVAEIAASSAAHAWHPARWAASSASSTRGRRPSAFAIILFKAVPQSIVVPSPGSSIPATSGILQFPARVVSAGQSPFPPTPEDLAISSYAIPPLRMTITPGESRGGRRRRAGGVPQPGPVNILGVAGREAAGGDASSESHSRPRHSATASFPRSCWFTRRR